MKEWRRSFSVKPPPIDRLSEYWPGSDEKYAHLSADQIPLSESLQDTVARTLPLWHSEIEPLLKVQQTVLVVAHGNSIRGLLKHLDGISDDDITKVEIPTGVPLVYCLDSDLKPVKQVEGSAHGILTGRFLSAPDRQAHCCSSI